jgi:hypothetical protein
MGDAIPKQTFVAIVGGMTAGAVLLIVLAAIAVYISMRGGGSAATTSTPLTPVVGGSGTSSLQAPSGTRERVPLLAGGRLTVRSR